MQIGRIKNATRVIGKSQGYMGLPLRDEPINCKVGGEVDRVLLGLKHGHALPELSGFDRENTPSMVTAWLPTPKEIAAINAGAPIHVRIIGVNHPPIMVETGEIPK